MAQLKETTIQNNLTINEVDNLNNIGNQLTITSDSIQSGEAKISFQDGKSVCQQANKAELADNATLADEANTAKKLNKEFTLKIGGYQLTTDFSNVDNILNFSVNNPNNEFCIKANTYSKTEASSEIDKKISPVDNKLAGIDTLLGIKRNNKGEITNKDSLKIFETDDNVDKLTKGNLLIDDHCGGNGYIITTSDTFTRDACRVWKFVVKDVWNKKGNKDKKNDQLICYHETQKTHDSGKNYITGTNICKVSSDIRLKENIKDSNVSGLDLINKIQLREFDWKDSGCHWKIGMVADEIEQLDPMLVNGGGYDEDGIMIIKGVDLLYLLGYQVKAIQELSEENQKLKQQILDLDARLTKLEN